VRASTRGERREFATMIEFAQSQSETVAIVADAVDRFQRSFKESVLIDELIRKEQVELHFYREGIVIGKGASSIDILRWTSPSWVRSLMSLTSPRMCAVTSNTNVGTASGAPRASAVCHSVMVVALRCPS
jgi:hypothetical protein